MGTLACNAWRPRRRLPTWRGGHSRAAVGGPLPLPGDVSVFEALDRHARRREEGIATLSVLVGPPERALELWHGWAQRRGWSVLLTEEEEERAMVASWATALAGTRDLVTDAEALVSDGRAQSLRNKTVHERSVLLERLPPPASAPGAWELCRALLEMPAPPTPGHLPGFVREAIAREPLQALQALLAIAPDGRVPALRVRTGASVFQRLRAAASLCASAPALTVACVLSPDAFEDCMRQHGSRVHAMMQEGRLDVEAPKLVKRGARAKDLERARSEPERFLYQLLCSRPSTADLFVLNDKVDLGDGNGPREVDLLCRELRLAVEVDGYFHFAGSDSYRRDQRKNVALQLASYLVVRYQADDVVGRLEEILNELDALIAARRRALAGQETPNGNH